MFSSNVITLVRLVNGALASEESRIKPMMNAVQSCSMTGYKIVNLGLRSDALLRLG